MADQHVYHIEDQGESYWLAADSEASAKELYLADFGEDIAEWTEPDEIEVTVVPDEQAFTVSYVDDRPEDLTPGESYPSEAEGAKIVLSEHGYIQVTATAKVWADWAPKGYTVATSVH